MITKGAITGHHKDRKAYFEVRDNGDKHRVRSAPGFDFEAAETNIYSTFASPVDLNNNDDVHAALHEWKVYIFLILYFSLKNVRRPINVK
jgi:hypothetical protein